MGVVKLVIGHKKREVIRNMVDMVEGRLSVKDFWTLFLHQDEYLYYIKKKRKKLLWIREKIISNPNIINLDTLDDRIDVIFLVKDYLKINHIKFKSNNEDEKRFYFFEKICPLWVTIYDYDWLAERLGIKDRSIEEMGSIKSLKEKVKSLFKYETYPPKWIQEAEWPIIDNIPALFIRQSSNPDSKEWKEKPIDYYFIDKDGKDIIITQNP